MAMRLVVEMIVLILKQFPPFLIQLFATNAHKDERHALDKEEAQKNHPNTITDLRNFFAFYCLFGFFATATTGALGFSIHE